jgi:hypothetical protein
MKCPYLAGNYMLSCAARREIYIPSTFEFAEYCNSERYEGFKVCSYYMEMYKGSQIKHTAESNKPCFDGKKCL